jgi:cation diffusion facilitator CzcD-associated flavoprotein CzcO
MVAMYSFKYPLFTRQLSFSTLLDLTEKQEAPQPYPSRPIRPRVAIIGAGITGVATACHIIDAGYDCHIFEAGSEDHIGGVWSTVNETSSLQVPSSFYKFHPAVEWNSLYPNRQEIIGQVKKLWDNYDLAKRSTFNCRVENTYKEDGKWYVNDHSFGGFDGLVAAVGTCGEMYNPGMLGQQHYKGKILHSSQLAKSDVRGKNVLVIGGGASAVEALEFAVDNGALQTTVLARVSMTCLVSLYNVFIADTCFSLRNGSSRDMRP